ncbi:MAG: hypothetical protein QM479_05905 [Pseudomonadota bacterium]
MKKAGISILITIAMLFSTTANSFYNSNNQPMIKMISVMMELMSHMMIGGASGNNFMPFPASPSLGMAGLPMSPINPMSSFYNNNNTTNNPWLNIPARNLLQQNTQNQSQNQNDSVFSQNIPFSNSGINNQNNNDSINGIWQALSGDIMAIYYNSNFIWTDGKKRHLAGSLVIKGSQLSAFIPANNKVLNFQFYRQNNKFAVKDSNGQIHIFTRIH